MTVLIFANGDLVDVSWIRPFLEVSPTIIAANGGFKHVRRLLLYPDVVIGDMDSLNASADDLPESHEIKFINYPTDKDETDLVLALKYAAANYQEDILVFGALGGRIDQTMANLLSLTNPLIVNRNIEIMEENQRAWLCRTKTIISGNIGDVVSLIPLKGDVLVKKTTGLKWPLNNETLQFGHSRGISNEMIEIVATVEKSTGELLCVHKSITAEF